MQHFWHILAWQNLNITQWSDMLLNPKHYLLFFFKRNLPEQNRPSWFPLPVVFKSFQTSETVSAADPEQRGSRHGAQALQPAGCECSQGPSEQQSVLCNAAGSFWFDLITACVIINSYSASLDKYTLEKTINSIFQNTLISHTSIFQPDFY